MQPETAQSLEAEIARTRAMVADLDERIARLEREPRRSATDERARAALIEHRRRAVEGLRSVEARLETMRRGEGDRRA